MTVSLTRSEKLDLRLTREAKLTLSAAALALQCSVSEFVLQSALARAAETLPDRQGFGLDADQWQAFLIALDASPRPMPRLAKMFAANSPFERDPAS